MRLGLRRRDTQRADDNRQTGDSEQHTFHDASIGCYCERDANHFTRIPACFCGPRPGCPPAATGRCLSLSAHFGAGKSCHNQARRFRLTSPMTLSRSTPRDAHGKALSLNLDPSVFGTFAEIGAGQEIARWFLSVGAASGTVAKTISAYDKTVSDDIYGASTRYVSSDRLKAMLDWEYQL